MIFNNLIIQSESVKISLGNSNICNVSVYILLFLNAGRAIFSWYKAILHRRVILCWENGANIDI